MIKTPLSTVIGGAFWTPSATILGGASKTLNQIIKSLFANNEQGFAYDPNDLTTMFQDAAGTIPVTTVGQPVGLMLDKGKGLVLGSEVIINGDFSSGKAGWTDTSNWWSIVGGRAYHPYSDLYKEFKQSVASMAGKFIELSFDIQVVQGTAVVGISAANLAAPTFTVGTHKAKMYALPSVTSVFFASRYLSTTPAEFYIDNVSIKELSGNHAYQTTSAARPILRDVPKRIDFDAVDDKLITNLPAQLSGCTVIRSVPNVGTQILTGQIIPATYEDNKDHCGLIVINRALTPSETSAIAAEFNKRAGV